MGVLIVKKDEESGSVGGYLRVDGRMLNDDREDMLVVKDGRELKVRFLVVSMYSGCLRLNVFSPEKTS